MVLIVERLKNSSKPSQRFIQGFNKVATSLTLMFKITRSSEVSAPRAFGANDDEVVDGGGGGADETIGNLSKFRKSKFPTKTAKSKNRRVGATTVLRVNSRPDSKPLWDSCHLVLN